MNALKNLNKEQWTALIAVAFGAIFILAAATGGAAPGPEIPTGGAPREYESFKQRFVEIPDDKFERYAQGKVLFGVQSAAKLPIPILKAPEPREEELPAPPFRPMPAFEAYNKLAVPVKYPVLTPGAPLVAEVNLPAAAEVEALRKLEEPAAGAKPDRRAEREREFLVVTLKAGGSKLEGASVTLDVPDQPFIFRDKSGQRVTVARERIASILYNRTLEEQYRVDSAQVKPGAKEADDRVKLAQKVLDQGMIPEAKAELARALELRKDHAEAVALLGQLMADAADFEGAVALYQAGLLAGAPAADMHYEIGRCLRALAFPEGAAAQFEKAVEASPRHHRAKLAFARALLESGQPAAAAEAAADFFTKLGNSPDTTPAHRAEGFVVRGLAHVRTGALDKAKADFAEALKIDAQNAEAMNGAGAVAAAEGKFPQAAPEFVRAIRANQYLTEAWTNLATLFLLAGKWAEAEALFGAAQQRDPASAEAVLGAGIAQLMGGKKDAPATIDRALAMDPRQLQVHMVGGHLRLREGADEEALARFVAALRAEYHYLPAYSGAAAAYLRTARKLGADDASARKAQELRVNAETLLRALKDFDPSRAGFWTGLGCAYAAMKRPDEARQALRMAVTLQNQAGKNPDPLVFYTLGYVEYYDGQGATEEERLDAAAREFAQAVKLKAAAADPVSARVVADAESAIERIETWKVSRVRVDERFEGENAKSLGAGWIESKDRYNVAITRETTKERGGRAKIAGKQTVKDNGMTSFSRDIPGEDFDSLEMTFYPEKLAKAEYGLSLYFAQQGDTRIGLHVGVDAAGAARFHASGSDRDMDGKEMVGWIPVKVPLPDPKQVTIKLTRGQKNRQTFLTLWLWDAAKAEWVLGHKEIPVNLTAARGNWRIAAWVRAWIGAEVLVYVDNIRVHEKDQR